MAADLEATNLAKTLASEFKREGRMVRKMGGKMQASKKETSVGSNLEEAVRIQLVAKWMGLLFGKPPPGVPFVH